MVIPSKLSRWLVRLIPILVLIGTASELSARSAAAVGIPAAVAVGILVVVEWGILAAVGAIPEEAAADLSLQ